MYNRSLSQVLFNVIQSSLEELWNNIDWWLPSLQFISLHFISLHLSRGSILK